MIKRIIYNNGSSPLTLKVQAIVIFFLIAIGYYMGKFYIVHNDVSIIGLFLYLAFLVSRIYKFARNYQNKKSYIRFDKSEILISNFQGEKYCLSFEKIDKVVIDKKLYIGSLGFSGYYPMVSVWVEQECILCNFMIDTAEYPVLTEYLQKNHVRTIDLLAKH